YKNFKVLTHKIEDGAAPIQQLAIPHIYNLSVNPDEDTPYNYEVGHSWVLYKVFGPNDTWRSIVTLVGRKISATPGAWSVAVAWRMERGIPTVVAREDHDRVVAQPQRIELVQQNLEVAVDHLDAVSYAATVR